MNIEYAAQHTYDNSEKMHHDHQFVRVSQLCTYHAGWFLAMNMVLTLSIIGRKGKSGPSGGKAKQPIQLTGE